MRIGADLARALDPALLARDCGVQPDPWQADLLRRLPDPEASRRSLLLCSRQSGKSTVTALCAVWCAIFEAPAHVVLVSPSERQSTELHRTVRQFLAALPGAPAITAESTTRTELSNGSRLLALPGTERTIRGIAGVDLVVVDEAARVEDELMAAVRPMQATRPNARLIALTTPAGRRGWFHEAWHHGGADWHRVQVTAADCPRISRDFLAAELRDLGAARFAEEYNLEWHDADEAMFSAEVVRAAFTTEVEAWAI